MGVGGLVPSPDLGPFIREAFPSVSTPRGMEFLWAVLGNPSGS